MVLHADAIAQDRPSGERARGIDGKDAHRLSPRAQERDQPIDQGALARTGIACDADDLCATGARPDLAEDSFRLGLGVVDLPHQPRGGADVPGDDAFGDGAHALSNSRAITIRWISLVPSPMVHSLTSR